MIAVIDLGSNSLRMGVYTRQNGTVVMIHQERYPVRLSEGLAQDNLLKETAMERTICAFHALKESITQFPGCIVKCVATAALRRAKNAKAFGDRVLAETGIQIEIIDGEKEAEYGLYAASLSAKTDSFYMLDTGGGSFEVVLCEKGTLKGHTSLPYGAVVLTETFHPDQKGTDEIYAFVLQKMQEIPFVQENGYPIVLLGGSNRMIGNMYTLTHGIPWGDGVCIPCDAAKEVMQDIMKTPLNKRMELVGMEKNRVDIITAGLMPLASLVACTKTEKLILSTNSIREGIANEYFNQKRDVKKVRTVKGLEDK